MSSNTSTAIPAAFPVQFVTENTHGVSTTMSSEDIEVYLQNLSDEKFEEVYLDIIVIAFMSVLGTISNIIVIYVYLARFRPSSTRSVIVTLAVYDLVCSCIYMPGEILTIRYIFNFPNALLCKFIRFLGQIVVVGSCFSITFVTYDRYHRICHSMRHQLTTERARLIIAMSFLATIILSTPAFFLYGLEDTGKPHVRLCGHEQKYIKSTFGLVVYAGQSAVFASVVIPVILLYCRIGRFVLQLKKKRKLLRKPPEPKHVNFSEPGDDEGVGKPTIGTDDPECIGMDCKPKPPTTSVARVPCGSTAIDSDPNAESSTNTAARSSITIETKATKSNSLLRFNKLHLEKTTTCILIDESARKTTQILFILSIVFILSFVPSRILIILLITGNLKGPQRYRIILPEFLTRSFLISSVTNCFIYAFCSPKFRRETKIVLKRIFRIKKYGERAHKF